MIHYHGTPISPINAFIELAGRHFCVSFMAQQDVARAHHLGQSVMLDNGAFTIWLKGGDRGFDWKAYYDWCECWLTSPSTWAVIPDAIDKPEEVQDRLIADWPFRHKGAPVWHMNESLDRLLRLIDEWPRVCIGSTQRYAVIRSPAWEQRMDQIWNLVARTRRFLPTLHMLRGMQLAGGRWPFASTDSTDIARNHNRPQNTPRLMADRWDRCQVPLKWVERPEQGDIFDAA